MTIIIIGEDKKAVMYNEKSMRELAKAAVIKYNIEFARYGKQRAKLYNYTVKFADGNCQLIVTVTLPDGKNNNYYVTL